MTQPLKHNKDPATIAAFGNQWARFEGVKRYPAEVKALFDRFFEIFPWDKLPPGAKGFEMGCGSGRFAQFVAPRVGKLVCVDAAPDAIRVAQKNLAHLDNVEFLNESVGHVSIADDSMDFGYTYGVLHHVPDTPKAIQDCVHLLKPGAPFLIYLYYRFDNRPAWFRLLWKVSDILRVSISRLPMGLRNVLCDILAVFVYFPLSLLAFWGEKTGFNVENWPLTDFRHASFARMRSNSRDRFGTPLEQRFTAAEIRAMLEDAGIVNIKFRDGYPYWCAVGFKSAD